LEGVPDDKLEDLFEGIHTANDLLLGGAAVAPVRGTARKDDHTTGKTETLFQVTGRTGKSFFVNLAGVIYTEAQVSVETIRNPTDLLRGAQIEEEYVETVSDRVHEAMGQIPGPSRLSILSTLAATYSPENPGTIVVRRFDTVRPYGLLDKRVPADQRPDLVEVIADQRIVGRVGNRFEIFKDWGAYHNAIGAR
jgi:hypothetical protein